MESNRNEIAFVVTSMGRGGAERVVSILANYYASMDWDVHIVMLWHDILSYKLDERITVHRLEKKGENRHIKIPATILRLRKTIKRISPSVVVSFIAQNNIISHIALCGLDIRLIPSERIDPSSMNRGLFYRTILNHVYAKSSVTVLQTERAKNYFPANVQKNSVIIYNPITVNCHAQEEREKVIVTAGRLEKQKNHKMLIDAFKRFHRSFAEYQLIIYGEGILRNELEAYISECGLENAVSMPGSVTDVQERMAKAEMFVLPSDFEGMSNALMEAMAIGLPCISTDCSGSDELITNGENGLLVPVGDEDRMCEALIYMASNRDKAEMMGKKAHEFSNLFATDAVISRWRETIEGCKYEH